jgi:hypothetical protein
MDHRMSHQWLAAAAVPSEEVLALRDLLDAPVAAEALADRARDHAPLLVGLLRQAGLSCADPRLRPLDARDAVERLGPERSRRHLHALALLLPGSPDPHALRQVEDIRRAAEHLRLRLQEADARPSRVEETLLRLLEWIPVQARALACPQPDPGQCGEWLTGVLGGARGLHPDLHEALSGLGTPLDVPGGASTPAARAAALARGVWQQTAGGKQARLDPVLLGVRGEGRPAAWAIHG